MAKQLPRTGHYPVTALSIGLLVLFTTLKALPSVAAPLQGAAQRHSFVAGEQTVLALQLNTCPVGEIPRNIMLIHGAVECARMEDRMWLHPLADPVVLAIPFPEALQRDFSLQFPVWLAEKGCPYVTFRLHSPEQMHRMGKQPNAWVGGALIGGTLACSRLDSGFGARSQPGRIAHDVRFRLQDRTRHMIAIQVRRGQARLYVDGQRVGMLPFRPGEPVAGMSLYFHRAFGTRVALPDAPALVGSMRLAIYRQAESAPEAERGLIDDLQAQRTAEGLKVVLSEALLFDVGDWHLKPRAAEVLSKVARLANLHRDGSIRIEGHTDSTGTAAFNDVLSELRAHVVALRLAQLGVAAQRLHAKGFGSRRPLLPNDTPAHRAANRRVEIILKTGR